MKKVAHYLVFVDGSLLKINYVSPESIAVDNKTRQIVLETNFYHEKDEKTLREVEEINLKYA